MKEEILKELEKIVGEDDISIDPVEIYVHSRDSALFQGFADVIVRPESTEEVAQILKLADEHRIPVYPRGSGTSICGGPIPVLGGIVLAMYKMNRIIEFDKENLMVTIEPGVICDDLNEFWRDARSEVWNDERLDPVARSCSSGWKGHQNREQYSEECF